MIQADVSKSGWGTFCNGVSTWGKWPEKEENFHINILELIASKFDNLTLAKEQSDIPIHLQIHNRELLHISKSVWNYLLGKQIALSVEYLLGALNVHADTE